MAQGRGTGHAYSPRVPTVAETSQYAGQGEDVDECLRENLRKSASSGQAAHHHRNKGECREKRRKL